VERKALTASPTVRKGGSTRLNSKSKQGGRRALKQRKQEKTISRPEEENKRRCRRGEKGHMTQGENAHAYRKVVKRFREREGKTGEGKNLQNLKGSARKNEKKSVHS